MTSSIFWVIAAHQKLHRFSARFGVSNYPGRVRSFADVGDDNLLEKAFSIGLRHGKSII